MKEGEKSSTKKASASCRLARLLQRLPRWLPTVAVLVATCWSTLSPRPMGYIEQPLFEGADKLAHAALFGLLTLCLLRDAAAEMRLRNVTLTLAVEAAAVATLIGVGIEYAQKYMELGRSFELADIMADATGAIVVAAAVMLINRLNRRAVIEDCHKTD